MGVIDVCVYNSCLYISFTSRYQWWILYGRIASPTGALNDAARGATFRGTDAGATHTPTSAAHRPGAATCTREYLQRRQHSCGRLRSDQRHIFNLILL